MMDRNSSQETSLSPSQFDPDIAEGINWKVNARQQDSTPPSIPSKSGRNPFMNEVEGFNRKFENYIANPALGFVQETANLVPGALNMGKHFIENRNPVIQKLKEQGKYNLPDVPYFDVAPHTLPTQAGEAASLVMGGRPLLEGGALALEKGAAKAHGALKKGYEYLHPETAAKQAETFRSSIGQGTSAENAEELAKRAQFAKQSTKQQALIPKGELYSQEGKSNILKVPDTALPEGNVEKLGEMIAPGEKFKPEHAERLTDAIRGYRAGKVDKQMGGRPIDTFLNKAEEIFNIQELPEKAAAKIEDVMAMPTSRNSKYFSDKNVTDVYSPKGNLIKLHKSYEKNASLNNYDALQSALKKELRDMEARAKISDTAQPKVDQLKLNIKNLDSDKEVYMKTLPEKMQNLENDFRRQYKAYAETYGKGKKGIGSSEVLRNLANGKHELVTDAQIIKVFGHPTEADKKIILDMGPSAAKNAIYAALQRVKPGDAEEMVKTILDLKRTKGFDKIITKEMEDWAHKMHTYLSHSERIRNNLSKFGSIASHVVPPAVGAGLGGPVGAAIGAAIPLGWKSAKYIKGMMKK